MTVIATDNGKRYSSVFIANDSDRQDLFTEVLTVRESTAKTYTVGQVLGTVTATGKALIATKAATDGSNVCSGIFAGDVLGNDNVTIPANTDVKVLVVSRGKYTVNDNALGYDASYATAADKTACMAPLKTAGVLRVSEVGNPLI